MRRKVDVTVGPDTCPLCGRRALADLGDEGIVCGGCDSAFELDRATGRSRYTWVSAAYQPLEARLSGSWLSRAEILEIGRTLTLGRARWLVMLSAGAIATIALFTCALGGAFALAPGIRDSQTRISQANASITSTLTLTPTMAVTATFGPVPTAAEAVGTPTRSPSPTAPGPLNSPLPTPSRASNLTNPTATRAQGPTGTPSRPAAQPIQSPTEALPTIVLPPTFTPVAALPLPATTITPTVEAIASTATVTVAVGVVTVTATLEPLGQSTDTPTPTPTPTSPPAGTPSTATPVASATSSIPRSPQFGVVVILAVNYRGTDAVNEADEYIDVQNKSGSNVQLQGWGIRRQSNGTYLSMPALTLLAGQTCRIYTANPQPFADCGANAFGSSYLWNNTADTLSLLDSSFRLVNDYSYPQ
ncbi:MAG: lamin tail domain-containing protein [Thermoflexales bacterium]